MPKALITIDEAHGHLDKWFSEGQVGNLIFSHGPGKDSVLLLKERSIKVRDLPENIRGIVELTFDRLECERAELRSDSNGNCDTVKVSRWMS